MPTLSSTSLSSRDLELSDSTLAAIQSVQLLADRINEACVEPARLMAERINEVYLEPWKQFSQSIRRMMEVQNKLMIQALAAELAFNKLFPDGLFNFPPSTFKAASIFGTANVIEGETEEVKETPLGSEVLGTTLIPRPAVAIAPVVTVQTKVSYFEVFENFNIALTFEGRFYYEGKLLEHISTNSKHGKFLKFFLEADNNYVTDTFALEVFQPPDPDKGLGYIRDDLIRYLGKDGLDIKMYRNRDKDNRGYKLLKISKFNN